MTTIPSFQRGKNSEKNPRKNHREEIPLKESFDVTRKLMIFRHSRRRPPTELQQLCACACMCVCVLVCPYVRVVFNAQHSFSRTFPPTVSCFLTSFPCWNSTCHPRPLASVSRLIKFSFHLSRDFFYVLWSRYSSIHLIIVMRAWCNIVPSPLLSGGIREPSLRTRE